MTKMYIIEVHLKHLLNLGYAEWMKKKELKLDFINIYEYAFEFLREEYQVNAEISSDVCDPTYYEAVYYVSNFLSDMELYKLQGYNDEKGNFNQFTDMYHLRKHLLDSCIQLVEGTLNPQKNNMDVTIKIPDSLVKKIIISAIEYDAGWFWIRKDSEKIIAEFFEWDRSTNKLKTSFAEAVYAAFDAGHSIVVVDLETEKLAKSPLDKESFKKAIYDMSQVHHKDYGIALYSELSGNHSAETSDKILQCTVFGEVLYSKKF